MNQGERLQWHHDHWDQYLVIQVQLHGFQWSDHVPIDRNSTGKHWIPCLDLSNVGFQFGLDVKRSQSGALRVAVFAPVWVLNTTGVPLLYRHRLSSRVMAAGKAAAASGASAAASKLELGMVAGQADTLDAMGRYSRWHQRYQAGLLALVADDVLTSGESEPFMMDYSDVNSSSCDFRVRGPNSAWSTPVSVAGMSASGGLVEMEQEWSHHPGHTGAAAVAMAVISQC